MNRLTAFPGLGPIFAALLLVPHLSAFAQVPVDDNGDPISTYSSAGHSPANGAEDIPLLPDEELQTLVGPIALYPDDLLAIVLPASAYPLQIVEAARFLDALESDKSLKPDPEWDDSVVALLNYPEVVRQLNDDLDWTWRLGEAVVSQQGDVVAAIEAFRDRAYAAGNLKSDQYQNVTRDEGVIEITPVSEDVIYVPYYEPERVVVYQPRPVYYYYPRAYPVYYYPYPSSYYFDNGFFWGVTTAFTIGWLSDSLHVYHHSYYGHPYFGRHYYDRWWYRRPSINIYNTTYVRNSRVTVNHYYQGDRWTPRRDRREYVRHDRETRNRYFPSPQTARTTSYSRREEPIRFRERPARQDRPAPAERRYRDEPRTSRSGTSTRPQPRKERPDRQQQPVKLAQRTGGSYQRRATSSQRNVEAPARVTPSRRNAEAPVRVTRESTTRPQRRSSEREGVVQRSERSGGTEVRRRDTRGSAPVSRPTERRTSGGDNHRAEAEKRDGSRRTSGRASREGRDKGRERRR